MSEHPEQIPFHPITAQYPLLEGEEFERFADSIEASGGPELPIHLWHGQIIDGRNRYRACQSRGLDPIFRDDSDIPEEDLQEFVEHLNEDRRHLTTSFLQERRKKRVERVAEKRRTGKSVRMIAEEEKISKSQVERDLKEATVPGGTVKPESGKVKGKDNREQPASRPKKTAPPTNGQPTVPGGTVGNGSANGHNKRRKQHKPEPLHDDLGNDVPERLRDTFADPFLMNAIEQLIGINLETISRGIHSRARWYPFCHNGKAMEYLKESGNQLDLAREALEAGIPHCVCPACEGAGCDRCRAAGYLPRWRYEELRDEGAI